MRQVPLVWRTLWAYPARLMGAATAVAVSITLIALLTGLWSGLLAQVTRYEDGSGGQLFVTSPGTRTLVSDASLPKVTVDRVRAADGVAWASPVRAFYAILDLHGGKVAVQAMGTEPGGRGGPWRMAAGRPPRATDELVVDEVLAGQHSLKIGDTVRAMGRTLTIVGLSADTAGFMVGYVFTTHATTDALLSAPGTTTFVLIGTDRPDITAAALQASGLSVIDRDALAESNLALATRVFGQPLRLMVALAFVAGALVIAFTTYGAVAEQGRLLGVLSALGATRRRLYRFAAAYLAATMLTGLALSAVIFLAGRALIWWWRPQFPVAPTGRDLLTVLAASVVMAALAGVLPARRIGRIDPADAFRSTT